MNSERCHRFKIRILTYIFAADNYGQILQAYALQRFLRNRFPQHDVQVLHVHPFICQHSVTHFNAQKEDDLPHPSLKKSIKHHIKWIFRKCSKRYRAIEMQLAHVHNLHQQLESLHTQLHLARTALRNKMDAKRCFSTFKQQYIALHCQELMPFAGWSKDYDADCYIVGSDQVFNVWYQNRAFDFFTLSFLPAHHPALKIAYAASFGRASLEESEKKHFQQALGQFDAIGLREAQNIATLAEFNVPSVVVPDPTALLTRDDYVQLIDCAIQKGQMDPFKSDHQLRQTSFFVYMLGNQTQADKDEIMDFLATKGQLIYTNANVDFSCTWDYQTDFAPSVPEFLACVRDCKMLITNSFHGISLAIIMNTPFVALCLGGSAAAMNTRFDQILKVLGLENRLVHHLEELKKVLPIPIDWSSVNQKWQAWRQVGIGFLEENIKSEHKKS